MIPGLIPSAIINYIVTFVTNPACITRLIDEFQTRSPMRATSLIVSVFGDTVSQHGGVIWLGSLVKALAPFGIDERLVRTSVFRLVKDGWLDAEKRGRRSFYSFTEYGHHEYQRAARRIYNLEGHTWGGSWQLVIPQSIPDEMRDPFRRSIQWQGFRGISNGVFARPEEDDRELLETINEFGLEKHLIIINGQIDSLVSPTGERDLVQRHWNLEKVAVRYKQFIQRFRSLSKWLGKNTPEPQAAFLMRTLLIHDYRRILLQDTPLPEKLLPKGWQGSEASTMTGNIYGKLTDPSIAYVRSELEGDEDPMPDCGQSFYERFSNLS